MRFVLDESSFDSDGATAADMNERMTMMADLLSEIRSNECLTDAGVISGWGSQPCWRNEDLAHTLSTASTELSRDARVRLLGLLGKCVEIDDIAEHLDPIVSLADESRIESYGVALALDGMISTQPIARGVVIFGPRTTAPIHPGTNRTETPTVTFIQAASDLPAFWRSVFEIEDSSEDEFFTIAVEAFPNLLFAENLRFSRFEGKYKALRSEVVRHLSALNDGWTSAYTETAGNAETISTILRISVSPESAITNASEALMKERDVDFDGTTYRCEWHSKLEPHRNRIHFHPQAKDKVLVGIFCKHLTT